MDAHSSNATSIRIPADLIECPVCAVAAGQRLRLKATGRWRDSWIPCGPDGYRNFLADVLDIRPRAESFPWFCLIGMLAGRPETAFRIGSETEIQFEADGQLVAFANDDLTRYGNNHGAVRLQVETIESRDPGLFVSHPHEKRRGAIGAAAEWVAGVWTAFTATIDRTAGLLFVAFLLAIVAGALLLLPQGRDVIRSVGENKFDPRNPTGWQQGSFTITLLFLAIQAWFWPRMIIESNYGRNRATWSPRALLEWTPRLLGMAPFAVAIYALTVNQAPNGWLAIVLVVLAGGLFLYLVKRNDIESRRAARAEKAGRRHRPVFGRGWASFGLGLAAVAMGIAVFSPVAPARILGGPGVVFLGLGLVIPPTVVAIQLSDGIRLPFFGAILLGAVIYSNWLDNHDVGRREFSLAEMAPARQITLAEAYNAWKAQAPKNDDGSYPIVLVASEGGASRAGFWTGEVLSALRQAVGRDLYGRPKFDSSLFAISSVSGGSVGAVGYVAALRENPNTNTKELRSRMEDFTGADALAPTVGGMLFPDLFQRFVPIPFLPDRAEALERSWEDSWREGCDTIKKAKPTRPCSGDLMQRPFLSLWDDFASGWRRPLVIVNGADEETGGQILTSKVKFTKEEVDASDFYDMMSDSGAGGPPPPDVRTSTAIHNGARFPLISPAGRLRRGGHIVDGGYFDPAGVEVVRELARAIQTGPGAGDRLHFVIVFIGYIGPPHCQHTPPPEIKPATFLNDLAAPLLALLHARDAHGDHMRVSLLKDLDPRAPSDPFVPVETPVAEKSLLGNSAGSTQTGGTPTSAHAVLEGNYLPILLCDPPNFSSPVDWALSTQAQGFIRDAIDSDPRRACPGNAAALEKVVTVLSRAHASTAGR